MKNDAFISFIALATPVFFTSCSTLEKTSSHGFGSGYYKPDQDTTSKKVYLDVGEEKVDVYDLSGQTPDRVHSADRERRFGARVMGIQEAKP